MCWISLMRWLRSSCQQRLTPLKTGVILCQRMLRLCTLRWGPVRTGGKIMSDDRIRGRVARILNSRELVLNIGSDLGVVEGMYFDIMDPAGEDIRDPETLEVLGSIERPKVRVQIIRVQQRISIATTYKKKQVNVGGMDMIAAQVNKMFMPPKFQIEYETFKTTEKTWEDLSEEQSYVKIGDPAVQVLSSEE